MLTSSRLLGAALLLSSLAACNGSGNPLNPGVIDHTNNDSFASAPPARSSDIDRDSVSGVVRAFSPEGTGSAAGTPVTAPNTSTSAKDDSATSKAVQKQGLKK